jgi:hypothetical protein
MIHIREPKWKDRSVGLAESKLEPLTEVSIDYKNIAGEKVFPHLYGIEKERALTYPSQIIKGTRLRLIPISELDIIKYKKVKETEKKYSQDKAIKELQPHLF